MGVLLVIFHERTEMEKNSKKTPVFGQIDDVISIGALLRPTIAKAVADLKISELDPLRSVLIEAEKELANSRLAFDDRFSRAQEKLRSTFVYAPVWRFIATRIEDTWKNSASLTVKELSVVSLLFGILLEETQNRISLTKKNKRSA